MSAQRDKVLAAVAAVVDEWGFDWVLAALIDYCHKREKRAASPVSFSLWLARAEGLQEIAEQVRGDAP